MTNERITKLYFDWMLYIIEYDKFRRGRKYKKLFKMLADYSFRWVMPMDANRADDGIDLRYRFGYEENLDQRVISTVLDCKECSVLEMMVALSHRCEESITNNTEKGCRTGVWFWEMIESLGLTCMTDEEFDPDYVIFCIENFLDRNYERNGSGGLFTINNDKIDMRKTEIWYQLMHYIIEYEK